MIRMIRSFGRSVVQSFGQAIGRKGGGVGGEGGGVAGRCSNSSYAWEERLIHHFRWNRHRTPGNIKQFGCFSSKEHQNYNQCIHH